MKEFKREFVVYLVAVGMAIFLPFSQIAYQLEGVLPQYVVAQMYLMPFFIILAAQFYMAKGVYEDSFEHDLDIDWWMIVPLLGPLGVFIYYLDREGKI